MTNLEDLAREVWGYADLLPLIDDIETAFKSRVAFVMRDNDYPEDPDGPPHNTIPVHAWAVILWLDQRSKLEELEARIHAHQDSFGISGREPGSHGIWENSVQGGHRVYEYWSQLIDGTGHLATLQLEDYFIISNHHRMLGPLGSWATPS